MALRQLLLSAATVMIAAAASPPRIISLLDDSPIVARLPNRTLGGWIVKPAGDHDELFEMLSKDNGRTWTSPRSIHAFADKAGTFGGTEPLVDRTGEVHLFLVRMTKYTMGARGEGERPASDDYRGNRIDIWHMKSNPARTAWSKPREIWAGYTGALNSVVQLKSGRIVLPFSYYVKRTWRDRGDGFAAFTYLGHFLSTVVYSDDHGETFQLSKTPLAIETPDIVSAYGAVEPVAIELKDGRAWMLIRGQTGRFYESFSNDGATWSEPMPSAIRNSDSPAGLARTDDGKLVLLWNNCQRFPYAYGGRQVLHAALSEDEGKSWTGYREVLKDPKRAEPPPPGGDFGTAYPFPATAFDGEVLIRSGQGKGRTALVSLDPKWLYETGAQTDFVSGLDDWTFFGTKGVERIEFEGRPVMRIAKTHADWPAGAVWNFPNGRDGKLSMKFRLNAGFRAANLSLADHYSPPWDKEDHFYSSWNIAIESLRAAPDRWHRLEIEWSVGDRTARVSLDGSRVAALPLRHESVGANYLRIRSTVTGTDPAGLLVESVNVSTRR